MIGLAAIAAGAVAYVAIAPFLSDRTQEKRLESARLGQSGQRMRVAQQAQTSMRKKQVADTIKDLEDKQKAKKRISLRTRIARAGLSITTRTFWIASASVGVATFLVMLIAGSSPLMSLLAGIVGAFGIPRWLLNHLAKKRERKFLMELANAIDVIVRGVKSGLPLNDCLQVIARETQEPVRSEFADLVEQQRVGVPLSRAFERMYDRIPVQDVNFFAVVIAIQQQTGGNLAEALSNLSQVLRDRYRLAAKVRTFSAEAKASAMIIASLPICVMGLVYLTSPDYIALLWEKKAGQLMLIVSGMWMLTGVLVMRKMIRFDY
jgi:tight adherence protein B